MSRPARSASIPLPYLVAGFITVIALTFVAVLHLTAGPRAAGHAFLAALEQGDMAAAYSLLSPDLQAQVRDVAGLSQARARAGKLHAVRLWSSVRIRGNRAEVSAGTLRKQVFGRRGLTTIQLVRVEDAWRVTAVRSYEPGTLGLLLPKQWPGPLARQP